VRERLVVMLDVRRATCQWSLGCIFREYGGNGAIVVESTYRSGQSYERASQDPMFPSSINYPSVSRACQGTYWLTHLWVVGFRTDTIECGQYLCIYISSCVRHSFIRKRYTSVIIAPHPPSCRATSDRAESGPPVARSLIMNARPAWPMLEPLSYHPHPHVTFA
jgi:hypothetical protein